MPLLTPAARRLREFAPTGRLLTEYRVRRTSNSPEIVQVREAATVGSLAIDVGAHIGNISMVMSKAVGRHGAVLALEPQPDLFERMWRSTWSSRVIPLNLAVSDSPGWAELRVPKDTSGFVHDQLGTLEQRDADVAVDTIRVRTARLDDLVGGTPDVLTW